MDFLKVRFFKKVFNLRKLKKKHLRKHVEQEEVNNYVDA